MVERALYYDADCVVYSAVRQYRGPKFAVCGDRTPVRVMTWGGDWSIEPDGLISPDTRVGATVLKPIAAIIALAVRQPPYAADWRKRDSEAPRDPVETVIRETPRLQP